MLNLKMKLESEPLQLIKICFQLLRNISTIFLLLDLESLFFYLPISIIYLPISIIYLPISIIYLSISTAHSFSLNHSPEDGGEIRFRNQCYSRYTIYQEYKFRQLLPPPSCQFGNNVFRSLLVLF